MKLYKKSGYCMADFWNICLYIYCAFIGMINCWLSIINFLCKYSKAIKTKTDEELRKKLKIIVI